jgi:hypothetical protein
MSELNTQETNKHKKPFIVALMKIFNHVLETNTKEATNETTNETTKEETTKEETPKEETPKEEPTKKPNKNKEAYIKQWRAANREKVNNYSINAYIKKIQDKPEYRNVLKERTKQRKIKMKNGEEVKPRGRPRKNPIKEPSDAPKPHGRPRKY